MVTCSHGALCHHGLRQDQVRKHRLVKVEADTEPSPPWSSLLFTWGVLSQRGTLTGPPQVEELLANIHSTRAAGLSTQLSVGRRHCPQYCLVESSTSKLQLKWKGLCSRQASIHSLFHSWIVDNVFKAPQMCWQATANKEHRLC